MYACPPVGECSPGRSETQVTLRAEESCELELGVLPEPAGAERSRQASRALSLAEAQERLEQDFKGGPMSTLGWQEPHRVTESREERTTEGHHVHHARNAAGSSAA